MIIKLQIQNLLRTIFLLPTLLVMACGGGGQGNVTPKSETLPVGDEWFTPIPTAFDTSTYSMTDLQQPGSRLMYISSTEGSDPAKEEDPTGQIYFWDGTQIVDATGSATGDGSVAYGADPMNPTGPIKPYQRWSYVAPRSGGSDVGTPWDGISGPVPGETRPSFRNEFPDWWLFARGDTFDLHQDYLSFVQESNPAIPAANVNSGSLAVPGGRSATEMQIVGAYGELSNTRPRFINPPGSAFVSRWANPSPSHTAYLSLHFDGHTPGGATKMGVYLNNSIHNNGTTIENFLLEDCWLDGGSGSPIMGRDEAHEVTLRRCLVTDGGGIYYAGSPESKFQIRESILLRNGFEGIDTRDTWPPISSSNYSVFSRNMYLSGSCDSMNCGLFDSISLVGASGDQFRPGMRLERNFFYQGYVQVTANGGYDNSFGPTGSILDNILQRFVDRADDDLVHAFPAHPGSGFEVGSGAYQVEVARNVVSSAQHKGGYYGLSFTPMRWGCDGYTFHEPTRENSVHDNIFDSDDADSAIRVHDGIENADSLWDHDEDSNTPAITKLACINYTFPGVTGNTVENNTLINSKGSEWKYYTNTGAEDTSNDTSYSNNSLYTSRAEAASTLGWPNPNRTLKTYVESLGYTVTSDDGLIEFYNEAKQQRKGYWRTEFTSRPLVNYIREGFGMEPLP